MYERDFTPRFFVSTLNSYEHDRFQNLDLRFVAGGGFGVNAIKKEKANLSFVGRRRLRARNFSTNLDRNSGEANFGDVFLYKFSPRHQSHAIVPVLPEPHLHWPIPDEFRPGGGDGGEEMAGLARQRQRPFLSNPVLGRQRNDLCFPPASALTFAK